MHRSRLFEVRFRLQVFGLPTGRAVGNATYATHLRLGPCTSGTQFDQMSQLVAA